MQQPWKNLSYCLYFTARDIQSLLIDTKARKTTLDYYAKLHLSKVYMECAHPDIPTPLKDLKSIIAFWKTNGIKPAGAILPVHGFRPLCYNNNADLESLKKQTMFLAGLFDEMIIDDWLFSVCTCPVCVKKRGTMSWADYRSSIVPAASQTKIIQAARKVNPRAKVIIKFPNWYEGYHHNGYNLMEQIRQFPEFCNGIETRGVTTHQQHIPTYTGYFLQRWTEKIDSKKQGGCWYDNWDMPNQPGEYIAQPFQGVLGGCREIIVWSAGTHFKTHNWHVSYQVLEKHLPTLDKLAGILPANATGVPSYVPTASDGECNIFGYLGMIGIPIDPVIDFPQKAKAAFYCLHSSKDKNLATKLLQQLVGGKTVIMTLGLFNQLKHTEIGNAFQIFESQGVFSPLKFRVAYRGIKKWSSTTVDAGGQFSFQKMRLTTWPYCGTISGNTEDGDYPVLLTGRFLNGMICVLNLPENMHDLFKLPEDVLNAIRKAFCADFGIYIKGKSRIGLYVYGDKDLLTLYNMNDFPAKASIILPPDSKTAKWKELFNNKKLSIAKSDDELEVKVDLKPYEFAVLKSV